MGHMWELQEKGHRITKKQILAQPKQDSKYVHSLKINTALMQFRP